MCKHSHTVLCRASLIILHVSKNTFFWNACHAYCSISSVLSDSVRWFAIILFMTKKNCFWSSWSFQYVYVFLYIALHFKFALYTHTRIYCLIDNKNVKLIIKAVWMLWLLTCQNYFFSMQLKSLFECGVWDNLSLSILHCLIMAFK